MARSCSSIRDSLDRIVDFFLHRVEIYHLVIVYVMGWVRRWKIGVKKSSVCKVKADRPGSELFDDDDDDDDYILQ